MADNLDFSVDNYSLEELLEIFGIEGPIPKNEIIERGSSMIKRYRQAQKPEYVDFFSTATNKLLSNYSTVESFLNQEHESDKEDSDDDNEDDNESLDGKEGFVGDGPPKANAGGHTNYVINVGGDKKDILPAENVWKNNLYNTQTTRNTMNSYMMPSRTDNVKVPLNLDHSVQLRKKLLLPNSYSQVPFSAGTMNPTLQNTYLTWVNVDSKYREIIPNTQSSTSCEFGQLKIDSETGKAAEILQKDTATNFIFTLNEPVTNVLSMTLGSLEVPLKGYYAFSNRAGNTTFDIKFNWEAPGTQQQDWLNFNPVISSDVSCPASTSASVSNSISPFGACGVPRGSYCLVHRAMPRDLSCNRALRNAICCPDSCPPCITDPSNVPQWTLNCCGCMCDPGGDMFDPTYDTFTDKCYPVPECSTGGSSNCWGPHHSIPPLAQDPPPILAPWYPTRDISSATVFKSSNEFHCTNIPSGNYSNTLVSADVMITDYLDIAMMVIVGPVTLDQHGFEVAWLAQLSQSDTETTPFSTRFIRAFESPGSGKISIALNGKFDWWINLMLPLKVPVSTWRYGHVPINSFRWIDPSGNAFNSGAMNIDAHGNPGGGQPFAWPPKNYYDISGQTYRGGPGIAGVWDSSSNPTFWPNFINPGGMALNCSALDPEDILLWPGYWTPYTDGIIFPPDPSGALFHGQELSTCTKGPSKDLPCVPSLDCSFCCLESSCPPAPPLDCYLVPPDTCESGKCMGPHVDRDHQGWPVDMFGTFIYAWNEIVCNWGNTAVKRSYESSTWTNANGVPSSLIPPVERPSITFEEFLKKQPGYEDLKLNGNFGAPDPSGNPRVSDVTDASCVAAGNLFDTRTLLGYWPGTEVPYCTPKFRYWRRRGWQDPSAATWNKIPEDALLDNKCDSRPYNLPPLSEIIAPIGMNAGRPGGLGLEKMSKTELDAAFTTACGGLCDRPAAGFTNSGADYTNMPTTTNGTGTGLTLDFTIELEVDPSSLHFSQAAGSITPAPAMGAAIGGKLYNVPVSIGSWIFVNGLMPPPGGRSLPLPSEGYTFDVTLNSTGTDVLYANVNNIGKGFSLLFPVPIFLPLVVTSPPGSGGNPVAAVPYTLNNFIISRNALGAPAPIPPAAAADSEQVYLGASLPAGGPGTGDGDGDIQWTSKLISISINNPGSGYKPGDIVYFGNSDFNTGLNNTLRELFGADYAHLREYVPGSFALSSEPYLGSDVAPIMDASWNKPGEPVLWDGLLWGKYLWYYQKQGPLITDPSNCKLPPVYTDNFVDPSFCRLYVPPPGEGDCCKENTECYPGNTDSSGNSGCAPARYNIGIWNPWSPPGEAGDCSGCTAPPGSGACAPPPTDSPPLGPDLPIPPFQPNQVQIYVLYYIQLVLIPEAIERYKKWSTAVAGYLGTYMPEDWYNNIVRNTEMWLWFGGMMNNAVPLGLHPSPSSTQGPGQHPWPVTTLPWPFPFTFNWDYYLPTDPNSADLNPVSFGVVSRPPFPTSHFPKPIPPFIADNPWRATTSPGFNATNPSFEMRWYDPDDPNGGQCSTPLCQNATTLGYKGKDRQYPGRKINSNLGWALGFKNKQSLSTTMQLINNTNDTGVIANDEFIPFALLNRGSLDESGIVVGAPPWIWELFMKCPSKQSQPWPYDILHYRHTTVAVVYSTTPSYNKTIIGANWALCGELCDADTGTDCTWPPGSFLHGPWTKEMACSVDEGIEAFGLLGNRGIYGQFVPISEGFMVTSSTDQHSVCFGIWIGIQGECIANTNGTNYITLVVEDFHRNRYNGNMPSFALPSTDVKFKIPTYTQQVLNTIPICVGADGKSINFKTTEVNKIKRQCRKGTPNPHDIIDGDSNLTNAQKYTALQIMNHHKQKDINQLLSPMISNVLIRVPIDRQQENEGGILVIRPQYSTASGGRGIGRRYYGPVTIKRLHIQLIDENGLPLELNCGNVSFSLLLERLYQY